MFYNKEDFMNFKVESRIVSSRSSGSPRDAIVELPSLGIFGVVNAYAEVHSPSHPAKDFGGGKTGNQVILDMIRERLEEEPLPPAHLPEIVRRINAGINSFLEKAGRKENLSADRLPGASFAFVQFMDGTVQIVQGGDCMMSWLGREKAQGLPNLACGHVSGNYATIECLMKKHDNDMGKMWDEFYPILSGRRSDDINNRASEHGYASLNGQVRLPTMWQEQIVGEEDVKVILLSTDGMFPVPDYHKSAEEAAVADLATEYEFCGGLEAMVAERRRKETIMIKSGRRNYVDYKNIAAIALRRID